MNNNYELEIVRNPYNNPNSKNRLGLIIKGFWDDSILSFIKQNQIKALYLNSVKGWNDLDYSFLKKLNDIEELQILTSREVSNLDAVECMFSLKDLSITCKTKQYVDFTKLMNLEKCFLSWWSGAESLFKHKTLQELYLDNLKLKNYSVLGELKGLSSLTIGNSPIDSIEWITNLQGLVKLWLLNCKKLIDFIPISQCVSLKWLRISGCNNLNNLDFVSTLNNLEILDISDSGEIKDIEPLKFLNKLKAFAFAGTKTKILNGDLSALENLPCLSMIMFQPRANYTHKLIKKWNWNNFNKPDKLLERKGLCIGNVSN